jgi:adenylate cyclase
MAIEIERKFLLRSDDWRALVTGRVRLRQAYLAQDGGLSTRIRIVEALLALRQGASVEKVRHHVPWHGLLWEIDVFEGDNTGLVIAEIELGHERQQFEMPSWIGAEITGQERYYNSRLARQPFRGWTAEPGMDAQRPS